MVLFIGMCVDCIKDYDLATQGKRYNIVNMDMFEYEIEIYKDKKIWISKNDI